MDYDILEEKRWEIAENFVYSCLLNFQLAGCEREKASHLYFLKEEEYNKYLEVLDEIKEIAQEENLNVEFKTTKNKGAIDYQVAVSIL